MYNEKENLKKEEVLTKIISWQIPECCREGWKSCPHVVKRQKISKRNIGL